MFTFRRLQLSASLFGPLPQPMSFSGQLTSSCLSGQVVFKFASMHLLSLTDIIPSGIVEELLGADLMEHNILHKGIGVTETLDTLARSPLQSTKYSSLWKSQIILDLYLLFGFIILTQSLFPVGFHDVSASDQPTDPQWSYFQAQR